MLLLFDIDGTLLHTNGLSREIFCQALGETYGVTVGWSYGDYRGEPDRQLARQLLQIAGVPADELDAGLPAVFTRVGELWIERRDEAEMVVYPGVRPLLADLAGRADVALGQVTANVRPAALGKLRAAGLDPGLFPVGAYGDEADERAHLPPLAIERAAAFWGRPFPLEEVIIVGDSPADVLAARVCGVRSLAVATGRYTIDHLAGYEPDSLLPDLTDLPRTLDALNLAEP